MPLTLDRASGSTGDLVKMQISSQSAWLGPRFWSPHGLLLLLVTDPALSHEALARIALEKMVMLRTVPPRPCVSRAAH